MRALGTALSLFVIAWSSPAHADHLVCGRPVSSGANPVASDALAVLRAAVGSLQLPLCVTDVNRSGNATASDSLTTLKKAVGQDIILRCVDCFASGMITPAGGTLLSHNGRVEIQVPAGALDAPTDLTIDGLAPVVLTGDAASTAIYDAYDLGPDGLAFEPPLEVTYHLPSDTFEVLGDTVTFHYPVLGTEAGEAFEPLGAVTAIHDRETMEARLVGTLSHYSPLLTTGLHAGAVSLSVTGFPATATVGDELSIDLRVEGTQFQISTPEGASLSQLSEDSCSVLEITKSSTTDFTQVGSAYVGMLSARCASEGNCRAKFEMQLEEPTVLGGQVVINVQANVFLTCLPKPGAKVVLVTSQEMEAGRAFRGPFGLIQEAATILAIGTRMGSLAMNVDDEEPEFDLDDEETIGHLGALPLRHCLDSCPELQRGICKDTCTEAWMQHGFGGIQIFPYDPDAVTFGVPSSFGGPFTDAVPRLTDVAEVAESVYTVNQVTKEVRPVEYDDKSATFEVGAPVVSSTAFSFSQTPYTLFPFPNGAVVTVTLGNGFNVPGQLLFHPAGSPAATAEVIGDVGIFPRRIRCAMCNGSSLYTCASTAAVSDRVHFSQIDPGTGAGAVTDDAEAPNPIGVTIFPKEKEAGCFAATANYGDNSYTVCHVDSAGMAGKCATTSLPTECIAPAHVAHAPDGRLLVTCNQSAYIVVIPPLE